MTTYAVVDLEATGITSGQVGHVIQIGITFIENYQITDTIRIDVKPPVPINQHITELTGITNDMLAEAPYFEEVAEYVQTILQGCVFVAHNLFFDYKLLQEEFLRVGINDFTLETIDTIDLAKIIYPYEKKFNLKYLIEQRNIKLNYFIEHQADSDSLATAHLFLSLLKSIEQIELPTRKLISQILSYKQAYISRFFNTLPIIKDFKIYNNFKVSQQPKKILQCTNQLDKQYKIISDDEFSIENNIVTESSIILVRDEQKVYQLSKMYENITPIYSQQYIYYKENIDFICQHLEWLSMAETIQFCSFLVWQTGTQEQFVCDLELSTKLRHYLSWCNYEEKKEIDSRSQNTILIMSFETFLKQKYYQQNMYRHLVVENIEDSFQMINNYFTKSIDISYILSNLSMIKPQLDLVEDQLFVDNILVNVKKQLKIIFKQFPHVREKMKENNSIQTIWMSTIDQNVDSIINELYKIVDQIVNYPSQIFHQKFYKTMMEMLQTIIFIKRELNENDIVSLKIKEDKTYHQFSMVFQKTNLQKWINDNITTRKDSIYFYTKLDVSDSILNYYQYLFGLNSVYTENFVKNQKLWHFANDIIDLSTYKEHLIVKKTIKFIDNLTKNILILSPSVQFSQKLVYLDNTIIDMKYFSPKLKETSIKVVATYEQLMKATFNLEDFDCVIVIKLPFDPPSFEESQQLLTIRHFNYFEKVTLPKMLIKMKKIENRVSSNSELLLLDSRVGNSSYKELLFENLNIKNWYRK